MEENIISDIKNIAIQSIKNKIKDGDVTTIRYYLDNINTIGDDSLVDDSLLALKAMIKDGDISAIATFYDYFSEYQPN